MLLPPILATKAATNAPTAPHLNWLPIMQISALLRKRRGRSKARNRSDKISEDFLAIFDERWYRSRNPAVTGMETDAIDHFLTYGSTHRIDPNQIFSTSWYLEHNKADEALLTQDVISHFLQKVVDDPGAKPHPLFDPEFYVSLYPDVAGSPVNPLIHYLRHGSLEADNLIRCSTPSGTKA